MIRLSSFRILFFCLFVNKNFKIIKNTFHIISQNFLDFRLFFIIMHFMIEIAFDETRFLNYNGKAYPVVKVPILEPSFAFYKDFALKTILKHSQNSHIILKTDNAGISVLKLAFAFFIASCLHETFLECAVFKVKNQKEVFEAYKPYIGASVGINYALRVAKLSAFYAYKELKCLNYLNFTLKENYAEKSILYTMSAPDTPLINIETHNLFDAIVNIAVLKALSLANIQKNISLKVYVTSADELILPEALINDIIGKLSDILSLS